MKEYSFYINKKRGYELGERTKDYSRINFYIDNEEKDYDKLLVVEHDLENNSDFPIEFITFPIPPWRMQEILDVRISTLDGKEETHEIEEITQLGAITNEYPNGAMIEVKKRRRDRIRERKRAMRRKCKDTWK